LFVGLVASVTFNILFIFFVGLQVMHPEMLHLSKGVGRRPLLIRNASAYLSKTVFLDTLNKVVCDFL